MNIAIIGAMEAEILHLTKALKNIQIKNLYGFTFYSGEIAQHTITILLSGVGKVSAAIGTTLLIEHYHPELIINTGTAGGIRDVEINDIFIASEVIHHDVDLTAFGYELGQSSKMPKAFRPDIRFLKKAKEIITHQYSQRMAEGLIVSGDAFISAPEKFEWIKQHFPRAKAVEMEAASIAQVCHQMQTPFIIIRAISDIAGEGNNLSFNEFVKEAGKNSAEFNIKFIKSL